MPRTTVDLDPHLLTAAKELAARSNTSLSAVVNDALRVLLSTHGTEERWVPVELPTYGSQGLQPGVDLEDKGALAALLEEE